MHAAAVLVFSSSDRRMYTARSFFGENKLGSGGGVAAAMASFPSLLYTYLQQRSPGKAPRSLKNELTQSRWLAARC